MDPFLLIPLSTQASKHFLKELRQRKAALLEPSPNSSVVIRQVWAASEFRIISSLIDKYLFVSIDTESPADFNLIRDIHAKDSVALLCSQGIDFARNAVARVSSVHFAKLAAASGLLFNKALTMVTFHGAYDIGYLVKILTWGCSSTRLEEFLEIVKELFGGNAYDVKHVMRFCNGLYGGLEKVADTLQLDRVAGKCHQAAATPFTRLEKLIFWLMMMGLGNMLMYFLG
ncbi:hypothetical protein HN51_035459 [Arachis hypogaea]